MGENVNLYMEKARKEYEKIMDLLEEMCRIRYPGNYKEQLETAIRCMEEILQGIVLITAIEDGDTEQGEWEFMSCFKSRANVMAHLRDTLVLRKNTEISLEENGACHLTVEQRQEMNRLLRDILSSAAGELYTSFAETDYAIDGKSYLQKLKEAVSEMIETAGVSDGDLPGTAAVRREYTAGLNAFYDIVERYWKSYDAQSRAWAQVFSD